MIITRSLFRCALKFMKTIRSQGKDKKKTLSQVTSPAKFTLALLKVFLFTRDLKSRSLISRSLLLSPCE